MRQAAIPIADEALEAEATDALGRGYYERGKPRHGHHGGDRLSQVKSAKV